MYRLGDRVRHYEDGEARDTGTVIAVTDSGGYLIHWDDPTIPVLISREDEIVPEIRKMP